MSNRWGDETLQDAAREVIADLREEAEAEEKGAQLSEPRWLRALARRLTEALDMERVR